MKSKQIALACLLLASLPLATGCDPEHKDKCEWYFEPDFERVEAVEPGWVALCARNRVVNKQKCLMKAKLEYAKALEGKPFRLSTVKLKDGEFPKEVLSVKVCKPG